MVMVVLCMVACEVTHLAYRARARDARSRVMPAEHQNTLTQRRGCCNAHNSYYREISSGVIAPMTLKQLVLLIFMWKVDRAATAVHLGWSGLSR
jgi:hypothetical protein